jgi:hypothetical protein
MHAPEQRRSREQLLFWTDNPKEAKADFPYLELSTAFLQTFHEKELVEKVLYQGREIRDLRVPYISLDMSWRRRMQVPE